MNVPVRAIVRAMIVAVMVGGAIAACTTARRSEPLTGPIVTSDRGLMQGRLSFQRHCYRCHTEGEGGMGPIINDKPLPKFLMRLQVRVGFGTMPSFSKETLPDDELDRIVDYIVALRHQH